MYQSIFDRQALHAKMLGFTHPSSGKPLQFEVEPPEDFQQLLETLRQLHVNHSAPGAKNGHDPAFLALFQNKHK